LRSSALGGKAITSSNISGSIAVPIAA